MPTVKERQASAKPQQPEIVVPTETHQPYEFGVTLSWGSFVFRVLTVTESIQTRHLAQKIYGAPLPARGTVEAGEQECNTAWILAELEQACVTAPERWDWKNIRSFRRVGEVWAAYQDQAETFRETVEDDAA